MRFCYNSYRSVIANLESLGVKTALIMQNPKKNRLSIFFQLLVVLLLCAGSVALLAWMGVFRPESANRALVLRVEASGGYALITMEAGSEKITQTTTVTTPWERRLTVRQGTQVFLTASNPTQTGQLSCSLTLDGRSWKTDATSAPKDGVACAGIIP